MIKKRQHLRLAREAGKAVWVDGDCIGQHLQRDIAIQLGVDRAIDDAYAAFTNFDRVPIVPDGGERYAASVHLIRLGLHRG
jgi:hypothetical protein